MSYFAAFRRAGPGQRGPTTIGTWGQALLRAAANTVWAWICEALGNTTASVTIANTTTETSMVGALDGTWTIPAGRLRAGSVIRLKLKTTHSTHSTAGNHTIRVKVGGTTIVTGGPQAAPNSASIRPGVLMVDLTCTNPGVSGTIGASFEYLHFTGAGAAAPNNVTAAYAAATINTTGALNVDVTYQWATANANNILVVNPGATMEIIR